MKIETGDILLVKTNTFLPRMIQWFQGNEYNHAGMLLILDDVIYVCEAAERGIRLQTIDYYLTKSKYSKLLVLKPSKKLSVKEQKEYINFMLPHCGQTPYEFKNLLFFQAIRYGTKKLFGKSIWIGSKDKKKAEKRFICGEWCGYVWNNFQPELFDKWYEIAPVDLFNDTYFSHKKLK